MARFSRRSAELDSVAARTDTESPVALLDLPHLSRVVGGTSWVVSLLRVAVRLRAYILTRLVSVDFS